MPSRRYPQIYEDDILFPVMSPGVFKHQCCDCGLVHKVEFDVTDAERPRVLMRWARDNRATSQVRRHKRNREGV